MSHVTSVFILIRESVRTIFSAPLFIEKASLVVLGIFVSSSMVHAQNGSLAWVKRAGSNSIDEGNAITVDPDGNVYATGFFGGHIDFGGLQLDSVGNYDAFVVKFDPNGNHVWSKSFGDVHNQWSTNISVSVAGDIAVSGYFQGSLDLGGGSLVSAGAEDAFLGTFDSSGGHIWSKRFGDAGASQFFGVDGLSYAPAGALHVAGRFDGVFDLGGDPLLNTFLALPV